MSDEIMLVFGEDGVARKYDDTWDITIHCESEEEQKAVLEKLNNSKQEAKIQLSAEGTTSDLISRRVAVDALWEIRQKEISDGRRFHDYCSLSTAVDVIKTLPSAQPEIEERKEESAQNVPKEDLISRKEAIEAMSESLKRVFPEHRQIAEKCLKALPSAQPEPQWIPVSERLPEVAHSVLFSRRSMDTREGCLQADDKWWQYRWNEILNANQVTAWMPLPEPYRAERRTDDANDIT